jgi:predicted NACHT family NTPase/transcriptional regulator with XRE-family HTH domain
MLRSLRVAPEPIQQVKLALKRKGFPSQQALATEMGMARATISNFLNGKPVDFTTFVEICERLGLDWQEIAHIGDGDTPRETEQLSYPLASRSEPEAESTSTGSDGTMAQIEEEFIEVARNWDLERLYADLETAKREWGVNKRWGLTTVEKQYLQGLLCGYSPDEIAAKLGKDVRLVRVQLSNNLYRYVEKLLDRPPNSLENWRDIVIWLAEAGYRSSDQFQQMTQNANVDIDALVQEVREKIKPLIQDWCGAMKVLDMSKPIELNDIYTDVNILEKITGRRRLGITDLWQSFNPESENFDHFGLSRIDERVSGLKAVAVYPKLMVLGKPGAGKTTFLKYLAIQCIEGNLLANLVPIFITLRQFAETMYPPDLQAFITNIFTNNEVTDSQIFKLLKHGRLFIFIDGLDEIPEKLTRRVIKQIQYFLDIFPTNRFVITSRIVGSEYKFVNFTEVEVADFNDEQIAHFAKQWFRGRYKTEKANKFIKKLCQNKQIKELATNPLMLTLLCLVFEEKSEFPSNRYELYKEAIDVLLIKWDASRDIERRKIYKKLSLRGKRDLLSSIAYKTFEQHKYFFLQKELEQHISDHIRNLPEPQTDAEKLQLDSGAVLQSIVQDGLLMERAKGIYSFSHLTFQEYFTTREILNSSNPQVLEENLQNLVNHITEKRWRKVFLLAVGMSQPADYLLQLMKQQVNALLAKDEKLQEFLTWVNKQSLAINISCKPAAIRSFYFDIDLDIDVNRKLGCAIDFNCTCVLTYGSLLSRLLNRNLKDTLDRTLMLAPKVLRNSDLEPEIAIALARVLAIDILEREFSSELEPELMQELQQLKEQLPDQSGDDELLQRWWKTNGQAWATQVKRVVNKYRPISEYWHFSEEQKELLRQYYDANILIVECLKSSYVTRELRRQIEDTLLLPVAK